MTDDSMAARVRSFFTPERQQQIADGFVAAVAASLPWSTSATAIFAACWVVAVMPIMCRAGLQRTLSSPPGGLPVLLVLFAAAGTIWAVGVPFEERWGGLTSFLRLLAIPLLIVQFQSSERAHWVVRSFIASCCALMVLSWINFVFEDFPWTPRATVGVPVKDYIAQSAEFTVCIFLLAPVVQTAWREGRQAMALGLALLIVLFLLNVVYVSTSRSVLLVFPFLLLLFAWWHLGWRQAMGGVAAVVVLAGVATTAPTVRENAVSLLEEVRDFDAQGRSTRAGERLVFWIKSIEFVSSAPVIGHGTGSIRDQFRRSVDGQRGMAALASANPHNQTLAVAIQLGFVGAALLFAMWLAHLALFWREGYAAWAGLVLVGYNIVGSLANSLLFDFTTGWAYVLGVGVAAGAVLKRLRQRPQTMPQEP